MTRDALRAEWTKLRTLPGNLLLVLAIVATTIGVSALVALEPPGLDPAKDALTGVQLGQAVVAILAVLSIGGEHGTGLIQVSVAAVPRRSTMLAAKATVLVAVTAPAATLGVLGSLLAAGPMIGDVSLDDAAVWRAVAGSVLYLVLIGMLSLGVAAAVRNSAAAVGVVLGLLYAFPIVAAATGDKDWQRHLQQIGPATAGLAVQATRALDELPIGPWEGLGVLALWAVGALLVGGFLLHWRDL